MPAVALGEGVGNRETESGAASAFIDLIKAVEDMREFFWGNGHAVVFQFERFRGESQGDFLFRVFYSVIEEDFENLAEVGRIELGGGFRLEAV